MNTRVPRNFSREFIISSSHKSDLPRAIQIRKPGLEAKRFRFLKQRNSNAPCADQSDHWCGGQAFASLASRFSDPFLFMWLVQASSAECVHRGWSAARHQMRTFKMLDFILDERATQRTQPASSLLIANELRRFGYEVESSLQRCGDGDDDANRRDVIGPPAHHRIPFDARDIM